MSITRFLEIPRGVLAHLLDLCGTPSRMSPRHLMGDASALDPLQIAQLHAGGYLLAPNVSSGSMSPLFKSAAEVLLSPATNLTFRFWGADDLCAESSILFPETIADGHGVMLTQEGKAYHLSAFIEPGDIIADLSPALPPANNTHTSPFTFEGHFTSAEALVLFCLLDLHRTEPGRMRWHPAHAIFGRLNGTWGLTGFADLTSYVQAVAMLSRPPSSLEIDVALARLEALEAIEKNGREEYKIADEIRPLADLTRNVQSGLQWQRVQLLTGGEFLASDRLYVYGDGGLVICFVPAVDNKLYVSTTSQADVLDFVVNEISGLLPTGTETTDTEGGPKDERAVAKLGAAQAVTGSEPNQKRAKAPRARTGRSAPPPPPTSADRPVAPAPPPPPAPQKAGQGVSDNAGLDCPNCAAQLAPGTRFCTQCGTKIEIEETAQLCGSCGAPLKPGAKFCTKCGTKR